MNKAVSSKSILLAAALIAAAPLAAKAQSNPSTDQIIDSLKPTMNLGGQTRGIRPSASSAAPSASAPSAAPAGVSAPATVSPGAGVTPRPKSPTQEAASRPVPEQRSGAPSVNLTVEFATGSADLTQQAIQTLDSLGRALASSQLASFKFRIEGHTDTVGSREANKALSERRAAAVVDYIVGHFNVDRTRLESVGMGEDGLLVQTPAQTAEPRNRRVQVVNLSA